MPMDGHDEANRSGRTLFYVRGYSLRKYFGIPDFLGQEGHLCILCTYCVKRHLPHGREVTYSDRAWKNMLPLRRQYLCKISVYQYGVRAEFCFIHQFDGNS